MRFRALFQVAAIAACVLLGAPPVLAAAQEGVEAVWAPRHATFVYQGHTTHYSCDGLRDEVREMLSKLGARDLKVRQYGCIRPGGVELFPGVKVTMQVLVPASSEHGKAAGSAPAHWREVVLMRGNTTLEQQGNCELIEQFKETLLPLFTTRHVSYHSNCFPHQLTLGTHLSAEVLMPDTQAARGR